MTDLATIYRLQRALSWTSSARTFVGQMPEDGQRVAVKILALGDHPDREALSRRFESNASALRSLGHPALPDVLAHGVTDAGEAFLVMGWFPGACLDELALAPGDVLAVILQLIEALESLALHGLVHLGVSPANVLVMPDHTAQLTGWGSSLLNVDWQSGQMLLEGGDDHTAPELQGAGGTAEALWRADLYSLASMAVDLLGAEATESGGEVQVRFPGSLSRQLNRPEALRSVLEHCLAPEPDQRPDAYSALSKAVQHAMPRDSRQDVAATQPMPPMRSKLPPAAGSKAPGAAAERRSSLVEPPPDFDPPRRSDGSRSEGKGVQAIRQETGGVLLPRSSSAPAGSGDSLFEATELGRLVDQERSPVVPPPPPAPEPVEDPQSGAGDEGGIDDSSTAEVVLPGADVVAGVAEERRPEEPPSTAPAEESDSPARLVSHEELEDLVRHAERRATEVGEGTASAPTEERPIEEGPSLPPPPPPTPRPVDPPPPPPPISSAEQRDERRDRAPRADEAPSPGRRPVETVVPSESSMENGSGAQPPVGDEAPGAATEARDERAAEATRLIARQPVEPPPAGSEVESESPAAEVQPPPPVGVHSGQPRPDDGQERSSWSPLRVGLAAAFLLVLLLTGSLVAGLLRPDVDEPPPPEPEVEPAGPVVEEPPPEPEPEPLPHELVRAAGLVGEGQWDEASELLARIEERAEVEDLTPENWEALRSVREALTLGAAAELAEGLEEALRRLDVNAVRTALDRTAVVDALRERPGGEALHDQGRALLRTVDAFRRAMDRGEELEPVERALELRESYPDLAERLEAERRSLARVEQAILEQMDSGRYVEAQLLIDRLDEMVELPSSLSTLRRRADRNIEDKARLAEVLRQAEAHGRQERPHLGLALLERESEVRSVDAGRYDGTLRELRGQMRALDGEAPEISLSGEELELKRGEPFVVELAASDDYGVVEVRFRATVDGGEALEIPVDRQDTGTWVVEIPESVHDGGPLRFWAVARDRSGNEGWLGTAEEPIEIRRKRWFQFFRRGEDDPGDR